MEKDDNFDDVIDELNGKKSDEKADETGENIEDIFNDEDPDKEKTDPKKENVYSPVLEGLKEKGLLDMEELPEDVDSEQLLTIIEDTLEANVKQGVEETIKDLPENVKELLSYTLNGGSMEDFISLYAKDQEISLGTDMEKEANQVKFMRMIMSEEGYDDDDIEEQIKYLKESDKLEAISAKRFTKWKENQKKSIEQAKEEQKKNIERQKIEERKLKENLSKIIKESDKIGQLPISARDKETLTSYMTDRTLRTDDGNYVTKFYNDLSKAVKNEKSFIQLAKLLRDMKDGDFDFKTIEKVTETKVAKGIQKN
jgi:hypothetical protein